MTRRIGSVMPTTNTLTNSSSTLVSVPVTIAIFQAWLTDRRLIIYTTNSVTQQAATMTHISLFPMMPLIIWVYRPGMESVPDEARIPTLSRT